MDIPYTWNQFLVQDTNYFNRLVTTKDIAEDTAKIPEEEKRKYLDILFEEGHSIGRHVNVTNNDILDRVIAAPPILGENKTFSNFLSLYELRFALAESLFASDSSEKIFKWLVSDEVQKDDLAYMDIRYGDYVGDSFEFKNNKIMKAECDDIRLVIRRDKHAMARDVENPFFFKIITTYPIRSENYIETTDPVLTEKFAEKLKESCNTNISNRLAWGLVLLNTEIVKIDSQNNILCDGKSDIGFGDKIFGVCRIPNSKNFIGVNVSQRGNREFIYGNIESKKVYNIPEEKLSKFTDEINLLTAKFDVAWTLDKFQCLVDHKVLDLDTFPEYDSEIDSLSNGDIPFFVPSIDELINKHTNTNNNIEIDENFSDKQENDREEIL